MLVIHDFHIKAIYMVEEIFNWWDLMLDFCTLAGMVGELFGAGN